MPRSLMTVRCSTSRKSTLSEGKKLHKVNFCFCGGYHLAQKVINAYPHGSEALLAPDGRPYARPETASASMGQHPAGQCPSLGRYSFSRLSAAVTVPGWPGRPPRVQ